MDEIPDNVSELLLLFLGMKMIVHVRGRPCSEAMAAEAPRREVPPVSSRSQVSAECGRAVAGWI